MKQVYTFKSVADAVKHYGGEANMLEALSSYATNQSARTEYNAQKNATLKAAQQLLKAGSLVRNADGSFSVKK